MLRGLWLKSLLLLLIVGAVALSGTIVLRHLMLADFREYLEGQTEDRVYGILAGLETSYEHQSGWQEKDQARDALWALTEGFEIRLRDGEGKVVVDTETALRGVSPLAQKRLKALSRFTVGTDGAEFVSYPLFLGGKPIGTLEVRELRQGREHPFVQRSGRLLFLSIVFVGAVAVLLSFLFSRRLARPIKELALAASAISRGQLKAQVTVSRGDEVGELAEAFNRMVNSLQTQESLRRKLIADVAHELRTPLGVMRGELEAIMDGLIANDPARLESLYEETARLKKMVDGIEELNQAEATILSLKPRRLQLKSFLENIVERFYGSFHEKGVVLELRCEENAEIYVDPDRFGQVVVNLLSNALRATQQGGHASILVETIDGEVTITVEDDGSGIREEDLPHVFERFYRGPGGGLGIGLTIVRELVEAQGGKIEVKSVFGKGASFTVFFAKAHLHNSS